MTVAEYRRLMSVLPNVWVGTSVEDQTAANERIPYLLKVPAAVRFLSCEPLLGSVDLTAIDFGGIFGPTDVLSGRNSPSGRRLLHWVICGGESGPKARPMHPDWARSLRDQCAAAGVPFHHKQNGEWRFAAGGNLDPGTFAMWPDGHLATAFSGQGDRNPKACLLTRKVGTKNTGRLLDGNLYDAFPEVANA